MAFRQTDGDKFTDTTKRPVHASGYIASTNNELQFGGRKQLTGPVQVLQPSSLSRASGMSTLSFTSALARMPLMRSYVKPGCCASAYTTTVLLTSYHYSVALTVLVGHQEEHPACKNWVMRCRCGYLSVARCRFFCIWPSWCHCIPKPHHLLPHVNPDWYYHAGTGLPR